MTDLSIDEINLRRAMLERARVKILLCDSSKFGKRALTRFATLDEIDLLVTDEALSREDTVSVEKSGLELIRVGAEK